jgi:hypothetical protein
MASRGPIEIRPGTPRDLCFIAANLRDQDRQEIAASALIESMTEAAMLSWYSSGPDWCWTAWLDEQPQAAFGISAVRNWQPHMRSAWAWGTARFKRCAPAITRFCVREWPQSLIESGVTRVEIRSLKGHDLAHRWLSGLRARREAELVNYGVHGETFELWAWLKEDWHDVLLDQNT